MRTRISYTIDATDDLRQAINMHYGRPGLATRAQVQDWYRAHGSSLDDDLMQTLFAARGAGDEGRDEGPSQYAHV